MTKKKTTKIPIKKMSQDYRNLKGIGAMSGFRQRINEITKKAQTRDQLHVGENSLQMSCQAW
jgi:hypothetical protein